MERRQFIEKIFSLLGLAGLLMLTGCGRGQKPAGFGNQEKLWQLAEGQGKLEEPIVLSYSKDTPALFRDASMGKKDPNFIPKVTGG